MHLKPPFWWKKKGEPLSIALLPLSALYGLAVRLRWLLTKPYKAKIPIICIGNFTVGGAGKTPTAICVASILKEFGERVAFLSRGYGGVIVLPHLVDQQSDVAREVGDEPLLLARQGPTIVSKSRPHGARMIEKTDATCIIMDDGFQNPTLAKDISIVVIDADAGLGNGRILPSGPLRASLAFQLKKTNAIMMIAQEAACSIDPGDFDFPKELPIFSAYLQPKGDASWLKDRPVIAYSGIGRPAKFFATLKKLGADVHHEIPFPDHHYFSEDEATDLLLLQEETGARLLTTEKDHVRLSSKGGIFADLREKSYPLAIELVLDEATRMEFEEWIAKKLLDAKSKSL